MITRIDIINIISKTAVIGTGIVFGTNIACLAVGHILTKDKPEIEALGMITILLIIVGIADLIAGFVIKRSMMSPLFDRASPPDENTLWQTSLKVTLVVSSICAALPLYGMVSLIIDGNMDAMVGFAIASLAGFMFLRLRPGNFRKLKLDDHNSLAE
jgi:purine-cytosine permease-like protein